MFCRATSALLVAVTILRRLAALISCSDRKVANICQSRFRVAAVWLSVESSVYYKLKETGNLIKEHFSTWHFITKN